MRIEKFGPKTKAHILEQRFQRGRLKQLARSSAKLKPVAESGIGKFSNTELLLMTFLSSLPLAGGEFMEEVIETGNVLSDTNISLLTHSVSPTLINSGPTYNISSEILSNSTSSAANKASELSYMASIVTFTIPWLVYMYRSNRTKKVFAIVAGSLNSQVKSRSSDDGQYVELEEAIDSQLPPTAEGQFNKLMTIITYLIDESKLPDDISALGLIKKLINQKSDQSKSELEEKMSRIITPSNFAVVLVAYLSQRNSFFESTKKDQKTLKELDSILLKLAKTFGLEEIYKEPQNYQNHLEVTRNIEQVGALFKKFKEQPFGLRKGVIWTISELYPLSCVFASIPGFFNFVEPSDWTRPFYSAAISAFLVAAYAANSKYVQGLTDAVMKVTDKDVDYKQIFPVMLCGALAIAASSTGSAAQDLAGDRIFDSTEKFFTGNNLNEFHLKSLFDGIFSATGHGLGLMSLGVASMSYYDVKDILASAWSCQLPEELNKKYYAFIIALPFLQIFAQFQTLAYCFTAFDKFKHYSGLWLGEELGEKVATGILIAATMGRALLVAKSFLLAQRRLYNEVDEHSDYFKKAINNLMKVFMALEEQELNQEDKNRVRIILAENFGFDPNQNLMKQLDAKRSDPKFTKLITGKGGIEQILQNLQNNLEITAFQPLEIYKVFAKYDWRQFCLDWGGLFANGAAGAMTISPKLTIPLSGGEKLPSGLRNTSAVAAIAVSVAICARFLGFKTKQEREKLEKYVNSLIGNEKTRQDLIDTVINDMADNLKNKKPVVAVAITASEVALQRNQLPENQKQFSPPRTAVKSPLALLGDAHMI
jgi:hypothetical protein